MTLPLAEHREIIGRRWFDRAPAPVELQACERASGSRVTTGRTAIIGRSTPLT
jgi:hypothetical protein